MRQHVAAVLIFRKGDQIAFIRRQNTGWMDGKIALPGGKVDPGESFTHAAIREAHEEVGATIKPENIDVAFVGHIKSTEGEIWTNVVFEIKRWQGELFNAEPHASSELMWLRVEDLPKDETVPQTFFYFDHIKDGRHYGELGWH